LFVLPTQSRDFAAQLLDLVRQVQQAAPRGRVVLARVIGRCLGGLAVGVYLLAQLDDGLAGLIVTKQGMGLQGPQGGQGQCARDGQ